MDEAGARRAVAAARVARLATVTPAGRVDLVPVTFALVGDELVTAVDHKPKRTTRLQRLANIASHPAVTVLVDRYEDDWDRLWWVRLHGTARVVEGGADHAEAVAALAARYPQYAARPPAGPAIRVAIDGWHWWVADPGLDF